MLQMPSGVTIRRALPRELDTIVTIDDEAATLYEQAGMALTFAPDHPFVLAERARWAEAIEAQQLYVACVGDAVVGFASMGTVDGEPYLDQLSVRPAFMRRGIGGLLLAQAQTSHRGRALWLTTYAHLPWNRPYYERFGFEGVADARCGPELREILRQQRAALPDPHQRVAMARSAT